ncbi:MAG: carbon storage regulator [Waddliaceae bacterium]|nr:carbon storage regulator [Waddliaceae bacterium]
MLVLTRKSEQKIVIGNKKKIVITVLKVQGDQVSLGFDADRDTPIYRQELLKEIEAENTGGAVKQSNVDVKSLAQNLQLKTKKHSNPKYLKIKKSDSPQEEDVMAEQTSE